MEPILNLKQFLHYREELTAFFDENESYLRGGLFLGLNNAELANYVLSVIDETAECQTAQKIDDLFDLLFNKSRDILTNGKGKATLLEKIQAFVEAGSIEGLLDYINDKSKLGRQVFSDLQEEFGENYLKVIAEIDQANPSVDGRSIIGVKENSMGYSENVKKYLMLKQWQDKIHYNRLDTSKFVPVIVAAATPEQRTELLSKPDMMLNFFVEKIIREHKDDPNYMVCVLLCGVNLVLPGFDLRNLNILSEQQMETIYDRAVNLGLRDEPGTHIAKQLKGYAACEGRVKNKAAVIKSDKDFEKLSQGDVVVALNIPPEIMNLSLKKAGGLILGGGLLCHGAIIARELGIPCVAGIDEEMLGMIHTGDIVSIDGSAGTIEIERTADKTSAQLIQ